MQQPYDLIRSALECLLNNQQMPDMSSLQDVDRLSDLPDMLLKLEAVIRAQRHLTLELESQLRQYAYIDSLTGVSNRRAGLQALQEQIVANAGKQPLSLCFVDLDGLKQVNDQFGHAEGDRFIRRVSRALLQKVRGTDMVARMGGDEFIVIMPGATEQGAVERMQAIMVNLLDNSPASGNPDAQMADCNGLTLTAELESPAESESRAAADSCCDYALSFSYGVATVLPDEWTTAEDMLRIADQRMYAFKRRNRNQPSAEAAWCRKESDRIRLGGTMNLAGIS